MADGAGPVADEAATDNAAWRDAAPALSVLVPFLRDDPRPLLASLDAQARALPAGRVEVVLLDDGGRDPALADAVARAMDAAALPVRLVSLGRNAGRALGRNRLAEEARGRHLLFLDADMAPERDDFLARWLALAGNEDPPAACGGFTVGPAPPSPALALHHALQAGRDCLPAAERARAPSRHVVTSNLLVRRDVLEAEPFDGGYSGWGWEDVDWGARVCARFGVAHPDIPARHLGLDTAAALLAKWEGSVANYARLLQRHPELVRAMPSFRAARVLRLWPARGLLMQALKRVVLGGGGPLRLRVAVARLYRAALYAEVAG